MLRSRIASFLGLALGASTLLAACKEDTAQSNADRARATRESSAPQRAKPEADATDDEEAGRGDTPPIRKDGTIYAETEMMGTRVSINVYVGPKRSADDGGRAVEAAFDEMARLETLLSEWQPQTELSRFNAAAGKDPVPVGPELLEVLERSKEISAETDGAFDVTFHGVGQLWSFAPGARPPSKEAVAKNLPLVDWRKLEIDPQAKTARLVDPGMMVGLGAIAKGYAVDAASAVLRKRGFGDHVVEAGGDTYASGTKGGKKWVVGVQNPDGVGMVGVIPSSDRAVVTSGNYQRFFEHEGTRYAHIIDPRTGWPVEYERSPKSVTLVASDATTADAFCTAVAVMGAEAGMRFIETKPRLEVVIVEHDDEVHVSSGLTDDFIRTTPQGRPLR